MKLILHHYDSKTGKNRRYEREYKGVILHCNTNPQTNTIAITVLYNRKKVEKK